MNNEQTIMHPGKIRIIAGKWRGRKLKVPEVANLRPTPDRVRETLFNWLAPYIQGARCLDPFAGSGALGFEAASRGAAYVEMTDQSADIVQLLSTELISLETEQVKLYQAIAPEGLKRPKDRFDIVFLDPPYAAELLIKTCHYLEQHEFLTSTAYVYLEANRQIEDNELPAQWRLIKSQQAGQVFYHLAKRG